MSMNDFKKKCVIVAGLAVAVMFLFFWLCPWRYEVHVLRGESGDYVNRVLVVDRLFNTVRYVVYGNASKETREVIKYSF